MSTTFKKLVISVLVAAQLFLFTVGSFATPTQAGPIDSVWGTQPWHNQSLGQYYSKVHDKNNPSEIFGERYTWAQVDWIIWSVIMWPWTQLLGSQIFMCVFTLDGSECAETVFQPIIDAFALNEPQDPNKSFASVLFKDRSLSGVTYVKDIGRKFEVVPEAQAQGFGYNFALKPIQEMWRVSRNATYVLFVIITIVMAFMIMFRTKTSPQTVITVQSALPKIFITLILITFSYAIAGFLIDLMYVVIGLVSWIGTHYYPGITKPEVTTTFERLTQGPAGSGIVGILFTYLFAFVGVGFLVIGVYNGAGIGNVGWGGLLWIFFFLMIIIILLAVLIAGLKTAWMLIKSYVMILLLVIFAPFIIAMGALGSGGIGFGSWVKSLVENLATFVVAGALYLLAFIFLAWSASMAIGQYAWNADLESLLRVLGNIVLGSRFVDNVGADPADYWPPLLGGGNDSYVMVLFLFASAVIFIIVPSTTKMIRSAISGQPFTMGSAIGEVTGPAMTGVRTATSSADPKLAESYRVAQEAALKAGGSTTAAQQTIEGARKAARALGLSK